LAGKETNENYNVGSWFGKKKVFNITNGLGMWKKRRRKEVVVDNEWQKGGKQNSPNQRRREGGK